MREYNFGQDIIRLATAIALLKGREIAENDSYIT